MRTYISHNKVNRARRPSNILIQGTRPGLRVRREGVASRATDVERKWLERSIFRRGDFKQARSTVGRGAGRGNIFVIGVGSEVEESRALRPGQGFG
jgi:hypothetical protein